MATTKNKLALQGLKNANAAAKRANATERLKILSNNRTARVRARNAKNIAREVRKAVTGSVGGIAAQRSVEKAYEAKYLKERKNDNAEKIAEAYNNLINAKDSDTDKELTGDKSITEVGGSGSKLGG